MEEDVKKAVADVWTAAHHHIETQAVAIRTLQAEVATLKSVLRDLAIDFTPPQKAVVASYTQRLADLSAKQQIGLRI